MSGYNYVPRVAQIYVKTLTTSWVQIITEAQAKSIRGIKIKARYTHGQTTQTPFDIAYNNSPATGDTSDGDGFLSYPGSGFGDTLSPSNGVWAKSVVAGTVIEIITYS